MTEIEAKALKAAERGDETPVPPPKKNNKKQRRCCLIASIIGLVILTLFIIALILALTVFKAKDPKIALVSTTVEGVSPRVTLPAVRIELNITLDLDLSVDNRNHASFKYGNGKSQVWYKEVQVGEVDVAPGKIPSRGKGTVKCKLHLETDKLNVGELVTDVLNRQQLVFEARTRLPGRVNFLGIIKKHVVAFSTCQITIQLPALTVSKQVCRNKTKL